jgi:hypothetical protein
MRDFNVFFIDLCPKLGAETPRFTEDDLFLGILERFSTA